LFDIQDLIARVVAGVAAHNLGRPGAFRRWSRSWHGRALETAPNPYGCADAANILYTVGHFPRDPQERAGWVNELCALQDGGMGMFHEETHHAIHTTAHCIAALELFDAGPIHPVSGLHDLRDTQRLHAWLDALDWRSSPWNASHKGAGLYVSLVLTGAVSLDWQDRYFAWLWDNSDPDTGFLRRGCVVPVAHGETLSIFPHLAGSFHYFFNHVYARRPFRYPQAVIDTCLRIYDGNEYPLGERVGFAEIDWVFCLTRSLQQCGHRFGDCQAALRSFAGRYVPFMCSLDAGHAGFDDLHSLFGAMTCLAELQQALPGMIRTERPLKNVLDRRPFI
jgi:hypothetical protein